MFQRLSAIVFIYVCCCAAWMVLGGTVAHRTDTSATTLGGVVGETWGGPQVQRAPTVERLDGDATPASPADRPAGTEARPPRTAVPLAASRLQARLDLEYRRKGLLWHPTYRVDFGGRYRVANESATAGRFAFSLPLPEHAAVFSNVALSVDGRDVPVVAEGGRVATEIALRPGASAVVGVRYASQGVGSWRYALGEAAAPGGVRTARDVSLVVTTDAAGVDIPEGTLSPTSLRPTRSGGRELAWRYGTLVAAADLGVAMPERLNPGPFVSRVTFFAPVSLFLFFFAVFVLSVLRGVRLHPMHYVFLGAASFAFHLLLAYLVDVVAVPAAMALASAASLGLVVSYVRLVAGPRFALVEVGGAQAVYLVGFAATFFLDGTTGLAVTLLSVATLFVVMQATGRMDWEALLSADDPDAHPVESR